MKPASFAAIGLAMLWLWRTAAGQMPFAPLPPLDNPSQPDTHARQQLAQAQAKDIAALHFTGHVFDIEPEKTIDVTNTQDIQTFLTALKYGRSPDGLLLDTMDVEFKPAVAALHPPITLRFDARVPSLSYNPEFRKALHTIVEPEQARRVRKIVHDNIGKVKAIAIYYNLQPNKRTIVTNPQEIQRLMATMEQIDARAFVFTKSPSVRLVVYLCLVEDPNGDYPNADAVRIAFLPDGMPDSKTTQKPPLPPELWKYCSSR